MKKTDKTRSKYYTIELYPKSENICFEDKIKSISQYDYAYILHDKDNVNPHYHVVVAFNNYRYLNAVSNEFEIPINYIEPIRSLDAILMYLIHLNDKSKYQYKFDEVKGSKSLLNRLEKSLKNNSLEEEDKIIELIDYISRSEWLSMATFVKYACAIGRYDLVRRSQFIFTQIIKEHNQKLILVDENKMSWYNDN